VILTIYQGGKCDPNMIDDLRKSLFKNVILFFFYFACIGYPSIETPVFAASPFPSTPQPQPQQPRQEQLARAVTSARSLSLLMFEFDPRNVHSHFSPAQFQQLLASLASQNLSDPTITGSASPAVSTVNPNATDLKDIESNLTP
jgi:hypothetical protein